MMKILIKLSMQKMIEEKNLQRNLQAKLVERQNNSLEEQISELQQLNQKSIKTLQTKFFPYLHDLNSSIIQMKQKYVKKKRNSKRNSFSFDIQNFSFQNQGNTHNDNLPNKPEERTRKSSRNSVLHFQNAYFKTLQPQIVDQTATTMVFDNGAKLTGSSCNGHIEKGQMIFLDGKSYEGQFRNYKFHGKGKLTLPNGNIYVSSFDNGKISNYSEIFYPNGDFYKGYISNLKKHGKGEILFRNKNKYIGDFFQGQITGFGQYYIKQEKVAQGLWNKGNLVNNTSPLLQSRDLFNLAQ